ncbi:putative dash complex subunit dad3 [Golovinomyces cichoracearum]|uniref:DASH complex subunit DAD3 n=1 Tax=Golovinomyces cichoracearum TaxID=62708 RepID=A0A420HBM6_9PEZI|nr:putative dash complex subunit dad3 [Golovinomyces cichoracearum]
MPQEDAANNMIMPNRPDTFSDEVLTSQEQDILEEYERLAKNMKRLAFLLNEMADKPMAEILDGLRQLERKTGLVFTLLKASVYSIVLQQEIYSGGQDEAEE